jgi:hypothetical protein
VLEDIKQIINKLIYFLILYMTQFDDIIVTPVLGPLTTSNFPATIPYHSYGSLPGKHPNPQMFYTYQEPVYADMNSNSRQQYARSSFGYSNIQLTKQREKEIFFSSPASFFDYSTGSSKPTSTHMNYISPIQSSMYTTKRKAAAVGKSGFKVGLPNAALYTTKNYYPSGIKTTLSRVRSGGCTAPKKKGSYYNNSLRNGQVCAWGSFPRQNY